MFLTQLNKLRESSKHAVADGNANNLDRFKEYLHIERPVEKKLKEIITLASTQTKAQLILVCGNVGDGKSHILSYLNSIMREEMSQFVIHNDATESHNPDETSNDTLYRLLTGFKDENIDTTTDKIILAINLGTLSKFLEEHGRSFTKLSQYVDENKILDTILEEEKDLSEDQNIHHINFTDYHLYSLTADGVVSETISTLLEKIVSDKKENDIYQAYIEYKQNYQCRYYCPILYNYEFLMSDQNRKIITQLIIKSIIKSKEIVSVRTLLNYIYDIIVPFELATISGENYTDKLQSMKAEAYLPLLIPNYIFEHKELSNLFDKVGQLDPCDARKEGVDNILLRLANTEEPIKLFEEHIDESYLKSLMGLDQLLKGVDKIEMSKFFVRLNYFSSYEKLDYVQDESYERYVEWLFHYNNNNTKYIQNVYSLAIQSLKKWYGDSKSSDKVIIKVGKRQSKYRIFKEVSPEPYLKRHKKPSENPMIHRFQQEFSLFFDIGENDPLQMDIDYGLFYLLNKITKGYRPNKKDNNDYVYFVQTINKIINHKSNKAPLYIDEVNIGQSVDYKLSKQMFDGYRFERV